MKKIITILFLSFFSSVLLYGTEKNLNLVEIRQKRVNATIAKWAKKHGFKVEYKLRNRKRARIIIIGKKRYTSMIDLAKDYGDLLIPCLYCIRIGTSSIKGNEYQAHHKKFHNPSCMPDNEKATIKRQRIGSNSENASDEITTKVDSDKTIFQRSSFVAPIEKSPWDELCTVVSTEYFKHI